MLDELMLAGGDISKEARSHIAFARLLELAFWARKLAGPKLSDDDIDLVAEILARAETERAAVTKTYLVNALVERGGTREQADALASAFFK